MSTALTVNWYQSNLGRRFTILDVLTPGDLTKGHVIAGTGT